MSKTPNPFHYPGLPPGKYKVVAPYTPFKFDDADYKAMLEGEKPPTRKCTCIEYIPIPPCTPGVCK